jgi:hypothetical protein
MNAGALALSCWMLVAGQNPSEGWATNQRDLKIPIDVRAWRPETINKLLLFVSADKGVTWQQHTAVKPKLAPHEQDQNVFVFRATADGEYWFRVAVVDHKGVQEPRDVSRGNPDQKILIDTRPPAVQILSAQRQGDEVLVDWSAQEDHPDWTTFKMEYRRADDPSGAWSPAPVNPGPRGPGRFRVSAPGALKVRLTLKDAAENVGTSAEVEVGGNGIITTNFPVPAPQSPTGPPPDVNKLPAVGAQEAAPVLPPPPDPVAAGPGRFQKDPPPVGGPPPTPPTGITPPPSLEVPPATAEPRPEHGRAVASTDTPPAVAAPAPPQVPPGPGESGKVPHKVINRTDVTVEYELAKVGPSGVGKVEVWLTKDDGQHWALFADDPAVKPDAVGPQKRRIPLPGEGVFGVWLVVRSRAGLGKAAPKPGDAPQLRVEVDLTPPVATLYEPVPDPSQRDTVVLSWTAADKHGDRLDKARLPERPITLEYSVDGKEWQKIAADVPNTGRHPWHVPTGVVTAYLRLRVRDQAGNEAVAVTPRPQTLDLSAPEVQGLRIVE